MDFKYQSVWYLKEAILFLQLGLDTPLPCRVLKPVYYDYEAPDFYDSKYPRKTIMGFDLNSCYEICMTDLVAVCGYLFDQLLTKARMENIS